MKHLFQGNMPRDRFNLYLSLTSINSEKVITALEDHLCKNMGVNVCCGANDVNRSNFNRAFDKINSVAHIVYQLNEL